MTILITAITADDSFDMNCNQRQLIGALIKKLRRAHVSAIVP